MKQWQFGQQTGSENLELIESPEPAPGVGEVLVRLRAATLNYRDLILVDDQKKLTPGRVPLSDGAGEVAAVGEDVTHWKVGDRVAGTFFRDWQGGRFSMDYHQAALGGSVDGVLREQAVFPQHGLVRLPVDYSYEEGATLPCAGLTAWTALMTRGQFLPGDSALLLGTGGVSIWGLQIVAAVGGRAIITSSSDEKLERAIALGAWETVNYRTHPEWEKEIHRLTAKRGVDHVLEVGGPQTLGKSLACVAAGGHIAQIGVLTGFDAPQTSLFSLVGKNANMSGIYVGSRDSFDQFVRFLDATKIKPVIDRTFDFADAPAAYEYMKSGAHFGKVVIAIE